MLVLDLTCLRPFDKTILLPELPTPDLQLILEEIHFTFLPNKKLTNSFFLLRLTPDVPLSIVNFDDEILLYKINIL